MYRPGYDVNRILEFFPLNRIGLSCIMQVTIDIDDDVIEKANALTELFGVELEKFLKSTLEGGIEHLKEMLVTIP